MFGAGNAIATAFRLWTRHLPRWLVLAIVFHVLLLAWYALHWIDRTQDLLDEYFYRPIFEAHPVLYGTVTSGHWIVTTLLAAAISVGVVARLRGERAGLGRSLAVTLRRSLSLFVAGLIVRALTVGVLVLFVIVVWDRDEWYMRGEGTYIVWAAAWAVLMSLFLPVVPALVVEQRGPLSAVGRGFTLGRGNRFKVFAVMLVGQALYIGLYFLAYTLVIPSPYEDIELYRRRIEIYGYVVLGLEALLATLWGVIDAVLYEKLREAKEGPAPSQLDRVFD